MLGAAQVLHDVIMPHTDSGAAVGDAIASFGAAAVLAPRGRFEIELYGNFMKLIGQVQSVVDLRRCIPSLGFRDQKLFLQLAHSSKAMHGELDEFCNTYLA